MPQFRLSAMIGINAHTIVEADTYEEAVDLARKRPITLAGSSVPPEQAWTIEDNATGLLANIRKQGEEEP